MIKEVGKCWSNNKLINELGKKIGSKDNCFQLNESELIDITLRESNLGNYNSLKKEKFF